MGDSPGGAVLVAVGESGAVSWSVQHLPAVMVGGGPVLMLACRTSGGPEAGAVRMLGAGLPAARMDVVAVGGLRLVWGYGGGDWATARVLVAGDVVVEDVSVGSAPDGAGVFVAAAARGDLVEAVELADGVGRVVATLPTAPPPPGPRSDLASRVSWWPVDPGPTMQEATGAGVVVAEGRLDQRSWSLAVMVDGDELMATMSTRGPAVGSGSSATGPIPRPGPDEYLGVSGSGSTTGAWWMHGWVHPDVHEVVLHTTSGHALQLPVVGQQLQLPAAVWAAVLPGDHLGHSVDAYDTEGHLVDRCWLAGALTIVEGILDRDNERRARAAEPVPDAIQTLWSELLADPIQPDPPTSHHTRTARLVPAGAVRRDWPLRPLLLPPGHETARWEIVGAHLRRGLAHIVSIGLRAVISATDDQLDNDSTAADGGPLPVGTVVVSQGLSWSVPDGHRDPPNTRVRDLPARLDTLTEAENNIDEISISWIEPAPALSGPAEGIAISIRANPHHLGPDALVAYANELRPVTD